jgi:DNA repair exonuclease SbcCD ATPase subunit
MIVFKSIRWKNLLSTGNTFTEIIINTHHQTLIIGENGAGKSTILDALSFVLYGKPFRKVNKGQLINSINNKNLLVECEFSIGTKQYLVRRGTKPTVFDIVVDNTSLNQDASSGDFQEMLEKHILKLSHKTFSQVVVLGSASFVPFMQLAAQPRREVIEDLLDIQVFTTMNTLLKDKIATNKNDILDIDYKIVSTEEKIEMETSHLSLLEQNKDAMKKQKMKQIADYVAQVNTIDEQTTQLLNDVSNLLISIQDQEKVRKRLEKVVQLAQQVDMRVEKLRKENEFFLLNHDCPTCRQGIDHDHKNTIVQQTSQKIDEIENGKHMMVQELERLNQRISEIAQVTSTISQKQAQANTNQTQSNTYTQFIESIRAELEALDHTTQFDDTKSSLKELKRSLLTLKGNKEQLVNHRAVLEVAGVLLKDAGIKTKIIRQYIPVINKLINKYLAAMDFFVNFELNENFEETIKSRFRDEFSYASFSEGEKSRIDLALLFTWRAVAKLRNSAFTNLLILDEVFDGSLDTQGNEELLKIIQSVTEGNNVFVISHKTDAYLDKFERVLKFQKQKNFSTMVEL